MGRYYNGDIEGKFWFGVQDSTDASFFGVDYHEPQHIEYYFDKEDLKGVEEGIDKCETTLGTIKRDFDKFFKDNNNNGYNDEMIVKAGICNKEEIYGLLQWYARLKLGIKIRDCIKKHGSCEFECGVK